MLEVSSLKVSYGQSEVIHGVDFTAHKNETLAIMGRNGMGKTTMFKTLIGILNHDSGTITLDGQDLTGLPSHARVDAGLAYVPQGRMIFSHLTVMENIQAGLEVASQRRHVPDEIFSMFPVLHDMRNRKGGNLSGGQQQQLAIARALVSEPKVLLLDEPTEGIQPSIIKEIAGTLNEIQKMRDITIVVSEQILSFTLDVADRIMVIESGKIVHDVPREGCDADQITAYLSV
ncbi:urea ABC transporter ATP-binding subunit UrtE [Vreelandella aquamarina]|uniref:urea ABC transporter ATP-binding subunit UrtE n=1 Tax=Vreelandella aquamarina TaxID=77097 RepID=UPI00384E9E11